MYKIKKGDIVGRKSYGKDIIFTVSKIIYVNNKELAILNGLIERIKADSEISDLELIEKQKVKEILNILNDKIDKRIIKTKEEIDNSNNKVGIFTRNIITKEKIVSGKILHLDGDRKYSEKSYRYYKKVGLNAIVKNIDEYRQPQVVYRLLEYYNPDILARSLLKLMPVESVMPSNHFILCRPLLFLPSIFPSVRVFSNESVLCIRWPRVKRKHQFFFFFFFPCLLQSGLMQTFYWVGW